MARLCMGCMQPLPEGRSACGICGYPADAQNPPAFLAAGTLLSERYLVGKVLTSGGDSAVYMGYDQVLKSPITIREFFPETLCERQEDGNLRIISGCEQTFAEYKAKFLSHARAVARLRDLPASIPIYDIFEQGNTAYAIREFCEGITLSERLQQAGGRMKWDEVRPLFMPLISSLNAMHMAGVTHLGISPDNLILGTDGRLHLDGCMIPEARTASSDLKPRLESGYAAPEQYRLYEDCGEPADVYGLSATIFRAITGNAPPDASTRVKGASDLLVPASAARDIPDHVASALFMGLQVDVSKRIQSIKDLRDRLTAAPVVSELLKDEPEPIVETPAEPEKKSEDTDMDEKKQQRRRRLLYSILIVLSVVIVLALVMAGVLFGMFPEQMKRFIGIGGATTATATTTEPDITIITERTQTTVPIDKTPVMNMVGKNYYELRDGVYGGRRLELEGLKFSNQKKGTILSQTPSPDNLAPMDEPIKVIISAGPEKIAVPNVAGWKAEHAQAYLEALGFRVNAVKVTASSYERGLVDSVSPVAGKLMPVGSEITLRISDQEPTSALPTEGEPTNPVE